jgi:hypothetical protein
MRDDERGKCSCVGVEKENDNLEVKAKPLSLSFKPYALSFTHKKAVGRC